MASKRAQRRRGCQGKKRHASEKAAGDFKRSLGPAGFGVWVYRCRFCNHYHLGHPRAAWKRERGKM